MYNCAVAANGDDVIDGVLLGVVLLEQAVSDVVDGLEGFDSHFVKCALVQKIEMHGVGVAE